MGAQGQACSKREYICVCIPSPYILLYTQKNSVFATIIKSKLFIILLGNTCAQSQYQGSNRETGPEGGIYEGMFCKELTYTVIGAG